MQTTVNQRSRVGAAPEFARATWLAAAVVVGGGGLGWLWLRRWGRVPFSVPSVPWYHCFPFYVFPHPVLAPGWALLAVPPALGVIAGVAAMASLEVSWPSGWPPRPPRRSCWPWRSRRWAAGRAPGGRRSTWQASTLPGSTWSARSHRSCAASRSCSRRYRPTPRATRPGR